MFFDYDSYSYYVRPGYTDARKSFRTLSCIVDEEMNLDKDVLGNRKYSKDTCMWIPQQMNVQVGGVYGMLEMGFEVKYPTKENVIDYINKNY